MKTETVHRVYSDKLDTFITKFYGLPQQDRFTFEADWEASDDTLYDFEVTGVVNEHMSTKLDEFNRTSGRNMKYVTPILLNDLAGSGVIPTGTYMIELA